MRIENPFHEGELLVQRRANETGTARRNGSVIADTIPNGALRFIGEQPLAAVGSLDGDGNVWASVLVGKPGFMSAPDERAVELDTTQACSSAHDPLWNNIAADASIGMLVIDLATRRRLRINGKIRRRGDKRLMLDVDQAYPNCPKYVQRRHPSLMPLPSTPHTDTARHGTRLGDEQKTLIATADTLFVASANPGHGVDASHRGGKSGFVQVLDERHIRIPDYAGNSMFNTLGNFAVYPRAGVVVPDFGNSRTLQLTGNVTVLWDNADPDDDTGGTGRYWDLEIKHWVDAPMPGIFRWEFLDYSPYNPEIRSAETPANRTLKLRVSRIRQMTGQVKSFQLRSADGSGLPSFAAGAHLPVRIRLPGGETLQRHYSILSSPDDLTHYEIAVLLEADGRGGSRYLHEHIQAGQLIEMDMPQNNFSLVSDAAHSILIAGGIGITPILSMAHTLAARGASFEVHYAARSAADLAYHAEIGELSDGRAHFYSSESAPTERLDINALLSSPRPGTHVYVCGPVRMIEAVRALSGTQGWDSRQIHFESFGACPTASDREITVQLARSGLTVTVSRSRTLLEALLDAGISIPSDCKRGECGMCRTDVLDGQPDHRDVCLTPDERERSMCVCVSRARGGQLVLDL